MPEQQSSLAKKIVKGAVVVLFFWFFWKFGGFLLNIIIGSLFPPGKTSDAYTGVYKTIIFTFIYSSALKVLVPAFMPVFIEKMSKDGEAKAWEFAYSIFNIVLILSIVVSGIGVVAAPFIIDLLVPGFSVETKQLCVSLLRIMLPGSVGLVLSMVMMSLFNSYKIFSFPAAADAAQKLVWAVAIFLGAKLLGMDART
ncbi:MAG TPA: lipid II flippase MurJ, partial [Planctomycetota bacterium]|nr:lipid II flippase MurJ [Planctomycetota bacterium]